MTMMSQPRMFTRRFHKPLKALAAGAMVFALLAIAENAQAQTTYSWTNTAATSFFDDPGVWSPVGIPTNSLDQFTIAKSGTFTIRLTNNFANVGSFQVGAAGGNQQINLTLDFGTNIFASLS